MAGPTDGKASEGSAAKSGLTEAAPTAATAATVTVSATRAGAATLSSPAFVPAVKAGAAARLDLALWPWPAPAAGRKAAGLCRPRPTACCGAGEAGAWVRKEVFRGPPTGPGERALRRGPAVASGPARLPCACPARTADPESPST